MIPDTGSYSLLCLVQVVLALVLVLALILGLVLVLVILLVKDQVLVYEISPMKLLTNERYIDFDLLFFKVLHYP